MKLLVTGSFSLKCVWYIGFQYNMFVAFILVYIIRFNTFQYIWDVLAVIYPHFYAYSPVDAHTCALYQATRVDYLQYTNLAWIGVRHS